MGCGARGWVGGGQLRKDSVNTGWRNESFRGYADYMQTEAFAAEIDWLVGLPEFDADGGDVCGGGAVAVSSVADCGCGAGAGWGGGGYLCEGGWEELAEGACDDGVCAGGGWDGSGIRGRPNCSRSEPDLFAGWFFAVLPGEQKRPDGGRCAAGSFCFPQWCNFRFAGYTPRTQKSGKSCVRTVL